ncbi:MAG TPA: hypothetical protein VHA12_03995 [Candidatus Nanoarchaeia archaeon]|nr:hypothetical protein [Candidatus Nanoarchaeia archaeon]
MINQKDREKLEQVRAFSRKIMPKLPYHNFEHGLYVVANATALGYMEGCTSKEIFLLETGGYTHDLIVIPGRTDNEERSAALASEYLKEIGYKNEEIAVNDLLVMSTKLPTNPSTLLEKIICDSDIWNIGGNEFWKSTEAVRQEYGLTDLQRWYSQVLGFLDKQKFYTPTGKALRNAGLEKNKKLVSSLLIDFEKERGANPADVLDMHLSRYGLREAA